VPKTSKFRISKASVDALPIGEDAVYFDARLSGFGVRTKAGGKKTYLVQYTNREGRRRRYTIGQHGALTPEEARELAQKLLGRVAAGEDPTEERDEERDADSVNDLWNWYAAAVELGIKDPRRAVIRGRGGMPKRASTYKSDQSMFKRHIQPLLGNRKIKDLVRRDVAKFVNDVTTGRTAKTEKTKRRGKARVTGGAGVATRAVGLLGSMMSYAISIGLIDVSPCLGVRRTPSQRRKVRLSPEQYIALGQALRVAEDEGEPWQAIEAIWALALTGCRKSEIAQLRPFEVDLHSHALRLTETKTGESIRPLGAAALNVLRPRLGNHEFVFYGVQDEDSYFKGLPAAFKRVLARVDKSVRMPQLTLHGLRHAYASQASDLGFGIHIIKELIGHAAGTDVTEGYVHSLDSLLVAAADKVAAAIYSYMSGAATALSHRSLTEDVEAVNGMAWQAVEGGQLVSLQEAAVMLGVGRPTVERLISGGELQVREYGRQRRLDVSDVLAYRREHPISTKPGLAGKLSASPNNESSLLTAEEAAMVLRVGRPTVMKLIAGGRLKAVKVGTRFKVEASEVIAFRTKHTGRRGNVDVAIAFA